MLGSKISKYVLRGVFGLFLRREYIKIHCGKLRLVNLLRISRLVLRCSQKQKSACCRQQGQQLGVQPAPLTLTLSRPYFSMACGSVRPTVPTLGWLNTTVRMLSNSSRAALSSGGPKSRLPSCRPAAIATVQNKLSQDLAMLE